MSSQVPLSEVRQALDEFLPPTGEGGGATKSVMTRKRGLHTATPWRARAIRFGAYSIEAELPCINGLSAWFSIATVHAVEDQEILMTEGSKSVAKDDAEFIATATSAHDTLVEALKTTLAALVATTSIIIRAEDMKRQPSKAVASDAMFRAMLDDYDAATTQARAALRLASGGR